MEGSSGWRDISGATQLKVRHTEACTQNLKLIMTYHGEDPDKDFKEFACQRHDPCLSFACSAVLSLFETTKNT